MLLVLAVQWHRDNATVGLLAALAGQGDAEPGSGGRDSAVSRLAAVRPPPLAPTSQGRVSQLRAMAAAVGAHLEEE